MASAEPQPTTPDSPRQPTRRQKLVGRGIAALLIVVMLAIVTGFAWQYRDYPLSLLGGQVHPVPGSARAITPNLPHGFTSEVYAAGLSRPRFLTFGPDGVLYVAEAGGGRVTALPMDPATGRAARSVVVASGLQSPTS